MNETYLIQRLNPPVKKVGNLFDNLHRAFGGHMLQLTKEAWDLLDPIFTIDYMGAAEYEFGTIPNVLRAMAQAGLVEGYVDIEGRQIKPSWDRKQDHEKALKKYNAIKKRGHTPKKPKPKMELPEDRRVYYLCRKDHEQYVRELIVRAAKGEVHTKCGHNFDYALDPYNRAIRTKGWLELDNGFFFFLDEKMWRRTKELFDSSEDGDDQKA